MEETTDSDSLHGPPPPLIYIPFDIIPETILCRLPVKSLLRFRCVCKSWNRLVSKDLKFAKKHLRVSAKRQYLVTTTSRRPEELTVTSCPFDSLNLHSILDSKPTQLDYSPIIPDDRDGLIASCDGLLCFVIDNRFAALYNPCTRKVKKLPPFDIPRKKGSTLFAFGYDPFIDNYKVVAVSGCGTKYVKVHSYTLGSDYWKRIKDLPSMFHLEEFGSSKHGIFIRGRVNWLTYSESYNGLAAIVSLHLGKESYQEITLPDYGDFDYSSLDMMRDCLCIFSQETYDSPTYVWLMKEYGNKESWIKLFRLPFLGSYAFHNDLVYISEDYNHALLVFRNNREFKWIVYDLKKDTVTMKISKIQDNLGRVKSKVYVESLISPS